MSYRDVPSTSKCPPMSNDDYSGNKSDYQESSKSVYFMTNTRSYDNPSPPITSESSNASFSENSLEFSSEESLHHKVTEEEIVFGLFIPIAHIFMQFNCNNFFNILYQINIKN